MTLDNISLCFLLRKVIILTTTRGLLSGECECCHLSMLTNCRCCSFSDEDIVNSTLLSSLQQLYSVLTPLSFHIPVGDSFILHSVVGSHSVIWLSSDSTGALTSFSLQTTFQIVSCIVPSYCISGFPFLLLYVSWNYKLIWLSIVLRTAVTESLSSAFGTHGKLFWFWKTL